MAKQPLAQALTGSYQLVKQDLRRYHDMGRLAADDIRRCCSNDVVERSTREFLQQIVERNASAIIHNEGGNA